MDKNTKYSIEKFKIMILEDSAFYNMLLKKQLDDYFENLGVITNCIFSIKTFTRINYFIENLSESTDVVLLDFYLDNGETALSVIEKIKKINPACKVIVTSGEKDIRTYYKGFWEKTVDFVPKDKMAPLKICRLIETIFTQKYKAIPNRFKYPVFLGIDEM